MTRRMNEAQAWREVARRIAEGEWQHRGLCKERMELFGAGRIDVATNDTMLVRVLGHVLLSSCREGSGFAYPPGEESEARIYAALWLALEAEQDDERRMRRGG